MLELACLDFYRALPLFQSITHHRAIVFSVLEGNNPGRVFVDDAESPRSAFITSVTEFFIFAGEANNPVFNQQIKDFVFDDLAKDMGAVFFGGDGPAWETAIDSLLSGQPGGWAKRLEFDFPQANLTRLSGWTERIPPGLRVERYDRAAAAAAGGLDLLWEGIDRFMQHGFGFRVAGRGVTLSQCHTVVVGDCQAELSVDTVESRRREGLACLAASAFIEHSFLVGLRPHWTCWDINLPSLALAEKLGFERTFDAPVRYVIRDG